jgi:hypothetical protein
MNSELEDEIDRIQEEDVVLQQKIADAKSKLSKDVNGTT